MACMVPRIRLGSGLFHSPKLPHLPRKHLPKLEAGPEQADLHRCVGAIYDLCDVPTEISSISRSKKTVRHIGSKLPIHAPVRWSSVFENSVLNSHPPRRKAHEPPIPHPNRRRGRGADCPHFGCKASKRPLLPQSSRAEATTPRLPDIHPKSEQTFRKVSIRTSSAASSFCVICLAME